MARLRYFSFINRNKFLIIKENSLHFNAKLSNRIFAIFLKHYIENDTRGVRRIFTRDNGVIVFFFVFVYNNTNTPLKGIPVPGLRYESVVSFCLC